MTEFTTSWHGFDRERCAEHSPRVVLCSCGFSRLQGPVELPPADHDELALFRLWHRWSEHEREVYDYWLALAKPFERAPLQAASLAARQVGEWREAGVLDWLEQGRDGTPKVPGEQEEAVEASERRPRSAVR